MAFKSYLFFMLLVFILVFQVHAQSKTKGLPVATPEQALEYKKTKEKDLLTFFRVTTDKEKMDLEKIKNKFKQRLINFTKAGKQLTPAEKAETELLQGDVTMMEAGLNPLKMTKDERVKVLKLLSGLTATKENTQAPAIVPKKVKKK